MISGCVTHSVEHQPQEINSPHLLLAIASSAFGLIPRAVRRYRLSSCPSAISASALSPSSSCHAHTLRSSLRLDQNWRLTKAAWAPWGESNTLQRRSGVGEMAPIELPPPSLLGVADGNVWVVVDAALHPVPGCGQ